MAGGSINATKLLRRQGIDPTMLYKGVVVDNNDSRKLCRVRVRVTGFFDGIKDGDLPWAVPSFGSAQGAKSEGNTWSGLAHVPPKGHVVGLRFPLGDPHKPQWCAYHVDEEIALEPMKKNYPHRVVVHLANGFYMIVDTKTNELFINNPGDMNMTVLGDVNQYIVGNQNLVVTNSKSDIDGYLLNAPDLVLSKISGKSERKIRFPGLLSKSSAGNQHTTVSGDQTVLIKGNRKVVVQGNDVLEVKRSRSTKVAMTDRLDAMRSETNG